MIRSNMINSISGMFYVVIPLILPFVIGEMYTSITFTEVDTISWGFIIAITHAFLISFCLVQMSNKDPSASLTHSVKLLLWSAFLNAAWVALVTIQLQYNGLRIGDELIPLETFMAKVGFSHFPIAFIIGFTANIAIMALVQTLLKLMHKQPIKNIAH